MGTQIKASQIELDRAIHLYMDEQDYISACTLAGAAEGILGEALAIAGKEHALASTVKGLHALLFDQEKKALGGSTRASQKTIWNDFTFIKNWLKHYYPDKPELTFNAKDEAYDAIDRAITNYFQLACDELLQMKRFTDYQSHADE